MFNLFFFYFFYFFYFFFLILYQKKKIFIYYINNKMPPRHSKKSKSSKSRRATRSRRAHRGGVGGVGLFGMNITRPGAGNNGPPNAVETLAFFKRCINHALAGKDSADLDKLHMGTISPEDLGSLVIGPNFRLPRNHNAYAKLAQLSKTDLRNLLNSRLASLDVIKNMIDIDRALTNQDEALLTASIKSFQNLDAEISVYMG